MSNARATQKTSHGYHILDTAWVARRRTDEDGEPTREWEVGIIEDGDFVWEQTLDSKKACILYTQFADDDNREGFWKQY